MVQGRDGSSFALESLRELFVRDFDRNVAAKPGVARPLDFTHASRTDASQDFIWPESVGWRK